MYLDPTKRFFFKLRSCTRFKGEHFKEHTNYLLRFCWRAVGAVSFLTPLVQKRGLSQSQYVKNPNNFP